MAILITYLILGGSGSSTFLDYVADSKDAVKTVMVKDERQKEALDILKSMGKRSREHSKQVKKTGKELGKLIAGREADTAEIATIADRIFESTESYNSDILDLRFELKEQVTREEWEQIFLEE